jgi:hypothetical protein
MAMNPRLLRPLASGFDPRSLGSLAGWWDASASSSITLNGGDVSQWDDLSGNARHAAQSTGANQPEYKLAERNGRNVIQFNGSSDFLRGPWLLTMTAQTTFAVVAASSTNNWGRAFTQTTTVDGSATGTPNSSFSIPGHYEPLMRNSNTQAFGSYNGSGIRATVNFTYDAWGVWSSTHTGTVISNRLNNGSAATYNALTLNTAFQTYGIGAGLGITINQYLGGYLAEVLTYTKALTDAERDRVHRYLQAKWNTP